MQINVDKIYEYVIQYVMSVISAIFIFLIGKWAARLIAKIVENFMVRSKINNTLAIFAKNTAYFGILVFVAIAALNKLGIETASFVALIGAAGLAVGFALQGSLANFSAGAMLVIFQPFKVGDLIEGGGAIGRVKEIQIFSTVLITQDNKRVIIPNAKISADKITIHHSK